MARRRYPDAATADAARAEQNRNWHKAFSAGALPWRVVVDGEIVAVFADERNARGFARARYGDEAYVELRKPGRLRGRAEAVSQ